MIWFSRSGGRRAFRLTGVIMLLWSVLLLFTLLVPAGADGIVVSTSRRIKSAEIPRQVGVITHAKGMETLTVWNTVKTDSQEMAWVLPLPSAPEVIQQTDPAAVNLVQQLAGPRVLLLPGGKMTGWIFGLYWLGIAIACLCTPFRNLRQWTYAGLLGSYLSAVALGAYGGYGVSVAGHRTLPVRVLTDQLAGNYQTTVISADSATQVNEWLTKHGFPEFDGSQSAIIEDYIVKKWVFLCARLRTDKPGLTQTHPLTVRFKTEKPIYPMRLTQAAGKVPVELYLAGDFIDASGRMKPAYATSSDPRSLMLGQTPYDSVLAVIGDLRRSPEPHSEKGMELLQELEIPFIPAGKDALLDGLVHSNYQFTAFSHTFDEADEWSDIQFTPGTPQNSARQYREKWNLIRSVVSTYGGAATLLGILLVAVEARYVTPPGQRPARKWRWMAAAAAVVIMGVCLFVASWNVTWVESSSIVRDGARSESEKAALFQTWMKSIR